MAENSKPGLLDKAEKILRRRKTKVLQSLGKQGRTTDEILVEDCQRLEKQQEVANRFQKDLRNYVNCARALSVASKTFYTTVSETYEPEWENHAQITEILTNMDMLWQDYLQKLHDQVQEPLVKYLATIPQIKSRVAKRGRKLIDYDNAKHGVEVQQNAKKKDESKIAKAQDDLEQAKKIYEDLNNELHQELPEFYNSRVNFYGNLFQSLFTAENVFQTEAGKVWASAPDCNFDDGTDVIVSTANKLSTDHEHCTYTPRKSVRNTLVIGSDENLTNGHSENGQTESPSSSSPSSPTNPVVANATVNLTNDHNEADTSKESIDDSAYESTAFQEQSKEELKTDEPKVEASLVTHTTSVVDDVVEEKIPEQAKVEAVDTDKVEVKLDATEEDRGVESEINQEEKKITEPEDVEVNGDLDTSNELEVTNDAPPPVPASPPPDEEKKDDDAADDDNSEQTEGIEDNDLYQVPPPAKPVDDDLPKQYLHTDDNTCDSDEDTPDKFLYKVVATHAYKGEDEDELSFDAQEVIYVIQYDDPDEQDPGWLMGVRKINRQVGVFPENFTKKV
ncbi:Histone deacetylase complex subunit SAP18 [Mactra antiquata]